MTEQTPLQDNPKTAIQDKPQPTNEEPSVKRLYRSRTDRMIGGVAGGMAAYFGMDSSLMRLIFILLVLLPGIGIVAYIIAWIVMPESPEAAADAHPDTTSSTKPAGSEKPAHHTHSAATRRTHSQPMLGFILVGLGAFFLLREFIDFSVFGRLWPLILILIGLAILFGRGRQS